MGSSLGANVQWEGGGVIEAEQMAGRQRQKHKRQPGGATERGLEYTVSGGGETGGEGHAHGKWQGNDKRVGFFGPQWGSSDRLQRLHFKLNLNFLPICSCLFFSFSPADTVF